MECAFKMLLLVTALGVTLVHGFPLEPAIQFVSTTTLSPDHVPSSVCESMTPVHGPHKPSSNSAPYVITTSKTRIAPGETIQVKLSGISGEQFKGIYVQGRLDDVPVGEFGNPTQNPFVRINDCSPGKKNAASYVSNVHALNELVLDWTAPKTNGKIVFKSTFVKTFSEFWVGVESPEVIIEG